MLILWLKFNWLTMLKYDEGSSSRIPEHLIEAPTYYAPALLYSTPFYSLLFPAVVCNRWCHCLNSLALTPSIPSSFLPTLER